MNSIDVSVCEQTGQVYHLVSPVTQTYTTHDMIKLKTRISVAFFSQCVSGKPILFIILRNEYTGICVDAIVAKMNVYVSQSFLIQLQTFRVSLEYVSLWY